MKIEAKDITFSYRERPVLKSLDFSADTGDALAILGPNGAGKSTLFRCLLGFIRPQTGEIYIDGKNIRKMGSAELARNIAYIPQVTYPVFDYTVLETVLMGLTNQLGLFSSPGAGEREKAAAALESLGIAHLSQRSCGKISGGERQLVLLARALAQNAKTLIMDEPTANLDYGNNWRVMEQVVKLTNRGYTVIFSTHDPNQAFMHANKALVMEQGNVLASGKPRDTLSGELLSRLYKINVTVKEVKHEGGEMLVSMPANRNFERTIQ